MIPVSAGNPTPFWKPCHKVPNAFGKFLLRVRLAQIDAGKLETARHEMRVRIIETRKYEPVASVDYPSVQAGKIFDLIGCADSDNPVTDDRQCLRSRPRRIHRMNRGVDDDQVGGQRRVVCVRGKLCRHDKNSSQNK